MRLSVLFFAAACAYAQSTSTTYTTDLNGYRVASATSASADHTKAELSQSINGQTVPLEKREQRVIRKDASGSVTETIVRKYSPTGDLISTERTVIDEKLGTGGASTVRTTTYRSDVNGREQEAERRVTETHVQGTTKTVDTDVERPTLNGTFETAERRSAVTAGTEASNTTTEKVLRPGPDGHLIEMVRNVTQETKSGGQTTDATAHYEPGMTAELQLRSQIVSTSVKQPDGSETTQVNLYAPAADGRVQDPGDKQQIKEQQLITRTKAPDGSVTETLSVRRPTLSDPTQLGGLQQISQTVCQGACDPPPPAPLPKK